MATASAYAGAGENRASGTNAWVNPGNITGDDASYSTSDLDAEESTQQLIGSAYGFAIPTGATIDGFVVTLNGKVGSSDIITSGDAKLVKASSITGTNRSADDTVTWDHTTDADHTFGASNQLFSATWSHSDVNATGFGFMFQAEEEDAADTNTISMDSMHITVYYTEVANPPSKKAMFAMFMDG